MNINQTAFCTVTFLAGTTIASSIAAATAVTTIATVAYAALATVGAAFSIAATTGWMAAKSDTCADTASAYFEKFSAHIGYALAGVGQIVAQVLFTSVIEGIGRGIAQNISDKITGRRTA